jgi:uncharacterized protein (TIGR00251 family)
MGPAPDMHVQAAVIQVKVKPRARVSRLTPGDDGVWLAELKSPPVEGRANEELVALVARHFGRRKSAVSIKSGASGRTKLVRIEGGARSDRDAA